MGRHKFRLPPDNWQKLNYVVTVDNTQTKPTFKLYLFLIWKGVAVGYISLPLRDDGSLITENGHATASAVGFVKPSDHNTKDWTSVVHMGSRIVVFWQDNNNKLQASSAPVKNDGQLSDEWTSLYNADDHPCCKDINSFACVKVSDSFI